jgi:CRP/FNR family cyclic AMP-dependent transcriptional regulator
MHFQQLIDKGFTIKKYIKDSIIYEPGAMPRFVYFILAGEIRMVTQSADGKEFIQGIFKAGQYFGEPALLVQKPYLAFTKTNKDSQILLVNETEYHALLKNDHNFSLDLIKTLSNRLFYKSMMLEELANEKSKHRLTTLINYLFVDINSGEALKYTRQDLADMTGLRVETVIRGVKSLTQAKRIKLIKGKIIKP